MGEPLKFTLPDGPELADESPIKHRVLSGNFTLILQASDQRSASMATLQLQGPIYVDDDPEEVNKRLDLYQGLIRRQQLIAEIARKEELNLAEEAGLVGLSEHVGALADQVKSGKKLATTQKVQVENYDSEVTKRKQLIAQRAFEITALKKKAGIA